MLTLCTIVSSDANIGIGATYKHPNPKAAIRLIFCALGSWSVSILFAGQRKTRMSMAEFKLIRIIRET
jgi:hypothetical protein